MSIKQHGNVFIADTARVLGEVTMGEGVNVWYGAVLRGDVAAITVGEGTNVQDNAVIHCDKGRPNVVGAHVTIGHNAIVHGVEVGDGSMIGMGARLLGGSRVGRAAIVAAGAVVPQDMDVPDGMVAMGVPAKVVRPTRPQEQAYLRTIPPRYVELAELHATSPDDSRVRAYRASSP